MQHVDRNGVACVRADISSRIVEAHKLNRAAPGRTVLHRDITSDPLLEGDLLMCPDWLFHLKTGLRWEFVGNFAGAGIGYLLISVVQIARNRDLRKNGGFAGLIPTLEACTFPEQVGDRAGDRGRSDAGADGPAQAGPPEPRLLPLAARPGGRARRAGDA